MKTLKTKKYCWLARENKNGWVISFEIGNKSYFLCPQIVFDSAKDVKKILKTNIVFVHKKQPKQALERSENKVK